MPDDPCGMLPMDAVRAQVVQLQRDVNNLISRLANIEKAAQANYEQDVPSLKDRIRTNEGSIERLRRENEAAAEQIL